MNQTKKLLLTTVTAALIASTFAGCSSNSLNTNYGFSSSSKAEVVKTFQTGIVTNVQKVIINDNKIATLSGIGLGAVAGGLAKGDAKSAVAGAVIGGIMGAFIGKEVEAYETTISSQEKHVTYLKTKLPINTNVEFVMRGSEISNVNVVDKY